SAPPSAKTFEPDPASAPPSAVGLNESRELDPQAARRISPSTRFTTRTWRMVALRAMKRALGTCIVVSLVALSAPSFAQPKKPADKTQPAAQQQDLIQKAQAQ